MELFQLNPRAMHYSTVIVGAGVVGSAIAFELSRRGEKDIHVFDPDLHGGFSSSERNAGGVRHLWQQPINSALSKISIQFFETIAEEIGFQQKGYLWLFSKDKAGKGSEVFHHASSRQLNYEKLDVSEIQKRFPFIDKTEDLAFGIFGPKDGILNTNRLKEYYRKVAISQGVTFHDKSWVYDVESQNAKVSAKVATVAESEIEKQLAAPEAPLAPSEETFTTDRMILAAGAWSDDLLRKYFPERVTLPVRRQMAFFSGEGVDLSPYGMIVDTSGIYFHAEGGNCLAGMVIPNEPPGYRFHYDHNFFEEHIWPSLFNRSTMFERLKPISGWGGLYSYTKDITGILGPVPGLKNVYEAHSFTGHGVMHSYGAAVLLCEKILDEEFQSTDGELLSRQRFRNKRFLMEDLHI